MLHNRVSNVSSSSYISPGGPEPFVLNTLNYSILKLVVGVGAAIQTSKLRNLYMCLLQS